VLDARQVVRRVRQRLGLSQAALARLLNATNGAIKHWEHGRHRPNFARLLALQQLCPRARERKQLDALIRQTQERVAPLGAGAANGGVREAQKTRGPTGASVAFSSDEAELLRLRRQVAELHAILQEKKKQLRILRNRTADLYLEVITLRASHSDGPTKKISN
jgi:transcriptional regulator with XRE-family HTH domain